MTAIAAVLLLITPATPDDVARLLELLRSDKVEVRQEAAQKLAALGEEAEPGLRREAASTDSEVSLRARDVLNTIETRRVERAWDERARRLPEACRDATYTMIDEGKEAGTLRVRTSLEKGKLVFDDEYNLHWRGNRVKVGLKQISSADHELRPERITVTADEPMMIYSAEAREKKLLITRQSQTTEVDLPRNLISIAALFRAVPILPKRQGFAFKFFLLDEMGRVSDESSFSCAGEEEISLDDRKMKAWKWVLQREEAIKGQDENDYYWATEERILRIRRTRGREFVLSSPQK